MIKVVAIGDSLALPGHLIEYEDTWICKVKKAFPEYDFITLFKRQLTTDILTTSGGGIDGVDNKPLGADCLEFFNPDIVILQLGIVDCAPRLIKENSFEAKVINRMPEALRKVYLKFVKITRKRSVNRAYVTPLKFTANLQNYLERCTSLNLKKVIVIKICYPDKKMLAQNPDIGQAVEIYNTIFDQFALKYHLVKPIHPLDSRRYDVEIFQDGYHPNIRGHELIYQDLKPLLFNA